MSGITRGVNSLHQGRLDELAMHPTLKPVALVADAIRDCSSRDGIVLDCFGGGGTTLIAAHKTGRRGYLIELDPLYVDVTVTRYQQLTGEAAVQADSDSTFIQVQSERASGSVPAQEIVAELGGRDSVG
jgi:DNA modification methylase